MFICANLTPFTHVDSYLDADPVYAWSIIIYITAGIEPMITNGQLLLTELVYVTTFAVLLSTISMVGWTISAYQYMNPEESV